MVAPTDLLGTWTLTRVVTDRRGAERRDVTGSATLTAESPRRVRWREEGTMTWPGHEVPVSRTLLVDLEHEQWMVRFEDGRPFHPWAVGAPVDHPCAPDHYRGLVEVSEVSAGSAGSEVSETADGAPGTITAWTVTWEASGPEKDYRMVTVHTRRRQDSGLTTL